MDATPSLPPPALWYMTEIYPSVYGIQSQRDVIPTASLFGWTPAPMALRDVFNRIKHTGESSRVFIYRDVHAFETRKERNQLLIDHKKLELEHLMQAAEPNVQDGDFAALTQTVCDLEAQRERIYENHERNKLDLLLSWSDASKCIVGRTMLNDELEKCQFCWGRGWIKQKTIRTICRCMHTKPWYIFQDQRRREHHVKEQSEFLPDVKMRQLVDKLRDGI